MNFANPYILWALPVTVLLTALWWVYGDVRRKKVLSEFAGGADIQLARGKRFCRRMILLAGLLLLIVAAARPCWGERPLEFNISESDALIVFDVSKSMLAEDVAPSRLEHGKWLLRELIKDNPEVSFGLAAFSGRSFISCPVTGDRVSLEQCIDELQCDLVPVGGTNLAAALNSAIKALKAAGGAVCDIILVTDGEELSGSITKELEAIKKANIRLLVVGLGDPAIPALIPETDPQGKKHFKRDRAGQLVRTRLNEELLRKIAAATKGIYINSNPLNTGVKELTRALSAQQNSKSKALKRALPIERFMIFLVLGSAALAIYMFMDEAGSRRKTARALILSGVLCLSAFSVAGAEDKTAQIPEKNSAHSDSVTVEKPDIYKLYNQARELQLDNKPAEAVGIYDQLLANNDTPPEIKAAAMHNLGVAEQSAGRMKFAEAAQISRKGDLNGALKNLDEAEKLLVQSEEFYRNVLKTGRLIDITSQTQQKQLADRKEVAEFRQKLQQLKKMQEQAREQTRNAQNKNKQNQQNQQQDKQQQNQQQGNQAAQNKQAAQDALKAAQKAVGEYQKAAQNMNQKELAKQAEQAAELLKNAEKLQQQNDADGAQKDIDKAVEALGRDEGKPGEKSRKEDNSNASGPQENPAQKAQAAAAEQSDNKMDAKQTDALLDSMSQDEKLLRDAIKSNRNRRIAPVEKDW